MIRLTNCPFCTVRNSLHVCCITSMSISSCRPSFCRWQPNARQPNVCKFTCTLRCFITLNTAWKKKTTQFKQCRFHPFTPNNSGVKVTNVCLHLQILGNLYLCPLWVTTSDRRVNRRVKKGNVKLYFMLLGHFQQRLQRCVARLHHVS